MMKLKQNILSHNIILPSLKGKIMKKNEKLLAVNLFDYSKTIAKPLLETIEYPWEALPKIKDFIIEVEKTLDPEIYEQRAENVWVAKSATVFPSAYLGGPLIVCEDAEIRHCAFIRGSAIVGKGAVVGNSTELKNSILFDGVQVPHYNYIGDSILGYKAHTGAGTITSNLKSDKTLVTVRFGGKVVETGVKKFGAMLGDNVEVGCNSVLNPGSVIGRKTNVYPLSFVRGYVPENSIYKRLGEIAEKV
jgi:NDP-sugar pyrophosphorylase family protein